MGKMGKMGKMGLLLKSMTKWRNKYTLNAKMIWRTLHEQKYLDRKSGKCLYFIDITDAKIKDSQFINGIDKKKQFIPFICFSLSVRSMEKFAHTLVVQKQHSNSVGTSVSSTFSLLCLAACSIAICLRSSATSCVSATMCVHQHHELGTRNERGKTTRTKLKRKEPEI